MFLFVDVITWVFFFMHGIFAVGSVQVEMCGLLSKSVFCDSCMDVLCGSTLSWGMHDYISLAFNC